MSSILESAVFALIANSPHSVSMVADTNLIHFKIGKSIQISFKIFQVEAILFSRVTHDWKCKSRDLDTLSLILFCACEERINS